MPRMAGRLDHVGVTIPLDREEEARAFYAGVLSFTEIEKPEPMRERGFTWFAEGLHLLTQPEFVPAPRAHPCFAVDDLDAVCARVTAAGHPVKWSHDWPGVRRFSTVDPFGNRIELRD